LKGNSNIGISTTLLSIGQHIQFQVFSLLTHTFNTLYTCARAHTHAHTSNVCAPEHPVHTQYASPVSQQPSSPRSCEVRSYRTTELRPRSSPRSFPTTQNGDAGKRNLFFNVMSLAAAMHTVRRNVRRPRARGSRISTADASSHRWGTGLLLCCCVFWCFCSFLFSFISR